MDKKPLLITQMSATVDKEDRVKGFRNCIGPRLILAKRREFSTLVFKDCI